MDLNVNSQQDPESMGSRFRRLRESKGMTREKLAERLGEGCTADVVRQYEDGTVPLDVDTMFAMTRALGVTPNDVAPSTVMETAASGLGDYARLNGKNRRMADQVIGLFLRQQRADGD